MTPGDLRQHEEDVLLRRRAVIAGYCAWGSATATAGAILVDRAFFGAAALLAIAAWIIFGTAIGTRRYEGGAPGSLDIVLQGIGGAVASVLTAPIRAMRRSKPPLGGAPPSGTAIPFLGKLALGVTAGALLLTLRRPPAFLGTGTGGTPPTPLTTTEAPACDDVRKWAPAQYPDCALHAYYDTKGSCEIPAEVFASQDDIRESVAGYCAALQIRYGGSAPDGSTRRLGPSSHLRNDVQTVLAQMTPVSVTMTANCKDLGSANCDVGVERRVFLSSLSAAMSKLAFYQNAAPSAMKGVRLKIVLDVEGWADATPFAGKPSPGLAQRYQQLARLFGQTPADDLSPNQMLACTRGLELLQRFEPELSELLREPSPEHVELLGIACATSNAVGVHHVPGATIHASVEMRVRTADPIMEKSLTADLQSAGWTTRTN